MNFPLGSVSGNETPRKPEELSSSTSNELLSAQEQTKSSELDEQSRLETQEEETLHKASASQLLHSATTQSLTQPAIPASQHEILYKHVERILEEDIEPYYKQMDPEDKKMFQKKGEHISNEITALIESTKDVTSQLLALLLGWLEFIRGVSHMFIEELARIKIQKLLLLRHKDDE